MKTYQLRKTRGKDFVAVVSFTQHVHHFEIGETHYRNGVADVRGENKRMTEPEARALWARLVNRFNFG